MDLILSEITGSITGIISAVIFAFYLATLIDFLYGHSTITYIKNFPAPDTLDLPKVSIIIPARNEAHTIGEALATVLKLDYPDLEVIAVNDRSTDDTGSVMKTIAASDPRIKVINIDSLPEGWLGKNHAMHTGGQNANGEYLLFTDADIHFKADALTRAMHFARTKKLDHLAMTPSVTLPGVLLNALAATFSIFFSMYSRPWKAKDPKSPRFAGIGAFNLVKAGVYKATGGFEAVKLRPDEDIRIGQLIKKHGYRQELAFGQGAIDVAWYPTVRGMIGGFEKNSFAGLSYSVPLFILAMFGLLFFNLFPFVNIFFSSGVVLILNAASIFFLYLIFLMTVEWKIGSSLLFILFPVSTVLFAYAVARGCILALTRGGIYWRGTFYSLKELRKNKV